MPAEGFIDRLVRWRFFPVPRPRTMVEVGAAGPEFLSIGRYFRTLGWRVVSVEPNPAFAEAHRRAGNVIHQVACADYESDGAEFDMVCTPNNLITYESYSAIRVLDNYKSVNRESYDKTTTKNIRINVRKLDSILIAEKIDHVDLLSVDVEGWELAVMRGLTINPTVVILENYLRDDTYVQYMKDRGYKFSFRVFPNDVYRFERRVTEGKK